MNKYSMRKAPLAAALGTALFAGAAQAGNTITVTTNADGVIGSLPGVCTLRAAIASANDGIAVDGCTAGSSGADTIDFANTLENSTITLTAGEIDITAPVTITAGKYDNPDGITIDAGGYSRIFNIQGATPSDFLVRMRQLTLTGGQTAYEFEPGGAIHAHNANIALDLTVISGNATLQDNSSGGGLAIQHGNATIERSTISGNTTLGEGSSGGGISVDYGALMLTDTVLSGNSVEADLSNGGGLYISNGSASLQRVTLSDNVAELGTGGGLGAHDSNVFLNSSTVIGNSTLGDDGHGGGAYVLDGTLTVNSSTFSANSIAGDNARGGGIRITQGHVELINSTVSSNTSQGDSAAGGLDVYTSDAVLTHATIANNTAGTGADGIHVHGTDLEPASLTLNNSLVVQTGAEETACNAPADSHTNTLGTDASCTGTATELANIDLGPLANHGGFTQTHALLADSVAIDAAGNCATQFGIEFDQRGQSRPGFGADQCDIGAFEVQPVIFQDRFESN